MLPDCLTLSQAHYSYTEGGGGRTRVCEVRVLPLCGRVRSGGKGSTGWFFDSAPMRSAHVQRRGSANVVFFNLV